MKGGILSIPWYESESDFQAILALVPFEESRDLISYPKWVEWIERIEADQKAKGNTTMRITIKPDAIKAWVQSKDILLCRQSISLYATEEMVKILSKQRR